LPPCGQAKFNFQLGKVGSWVPAKGDQRVGCEHKIRVFAVATLSFFSLHLHHDALHDDDDNDEVVMADDNDADNGLRRTKICL